MGERAAATLGGEVAARSAMRRLSDCRCSVACSCRASACSRRSSASAPAAAEGGAARAAGAAAAGAVAAGVAAAAAATAVAAARCRSRCDLTVTTSIPRSPTKLRLVDESRQKPLHAARPSVDARAVAAAEARGLCSAPSSAAIAARLSTKLPNLGAKLNTAAGALASLPAAAAAAAATSCSMPPAVQPHAACVALQAPSRIAAQLAPQWGGGEVARNVASAAVGSSSTCSR